MLRSERNTDFVEKYGRETTKGDPTIFFQTHGGKIYCRAWYGSLLAHNSPISAVSPIIHTKKRHVVILKDINYAHVKDGILKQFLFYFKMVEYSENFMHLYSYFQEQSRDPPLVQMTNLRLEDA